MNTVNNVGNNLLSRATVPYDAALAVGSGLASSCGACSTVYCGRTSSCETYLLTTATKVIETSSYLHK